MKALLHFRTDLGPRTVVAEIGDAVSARAIVNAHLALGEQASLVEQMPRLSMAEHLARHAKKRQRTALKLASVLPANVTPIRARKRGGA